MRDEHADECLRTNKTHLRGCCSVCGRAQNERGEGRAEARLRRWNYMHSTSLTRFVSHSSVECVDASPSALGLSRMRLKQVSASLRLAAEWLRSFRMRRRIVRLSEYVRADRLIGRRDSVTESMSAPARSEPGSSAPVKTHATVSQAAECRQSHARMKQVFRRGTELIN